MRKQLLFFLILTHSIYSQDFILSGRHSITLHSSHSANIYIAEKNELLKFLNENKSELIKKGEQFSFLNKSKSIDIDVLKKVIKTGKYIQKDYSMNPLYAVSNANKNTPYTVKNLSSDTYLIWVYGNRQVSIKEVTLPASRKILFFDLNEYYITITSDPPGAYIYIDGKKLDNKTPYTIKHPAGNIEIEIDKPFYADQNGKYISKKEFILEGITEKKIHFKLHRIPSAWVSIKTNPENADIFLNGKKISSEPGGMIKVEANREYQLKIMKRNYETINKKFTLNPDEVRKMKEDLKPLNNNGSVAFIFPALYVPTFQNNTYKENFTSNGFFGPLGFALGFVGLAPNHFIFEYFHGFYWKKANNEYSNFNGKIFGHDLSISFGAYTSIGNVILFLNGGPKYYYMNESIEISEYAESDTSLTMENHFSGWTPTINAGIHFINKRNGAFSWFIRSSYDFRKNKVTWHQLAFAIGIIRYN